MSILSMKVAEALDDEMGRWAGKNVAVQFSGGLDSGLIGALACRHARHAKLYVAGTEGCHDMSAAASAAEALGADLERIIIPPGECTGLIAAQMKATGTVNPLVLAFSAPLFAVLRECGEDTVLTGQCADEIFGGYGKYLRLSDADLVREMDRDMERFLREGAPHDSAMCRYFGKKIFRPYLGDRIREVMASATPADIRPSPSERKRVLCDAAADLGFGFLAERPKKAAQYGSGILYAAKAALRPSGTEFNAFVASSAAAGGLLPARR